ncbi:hypothetical protein GCM10008904_28210 [Paraclostridium ghonii]|uniref:Uncharacterized protein n=1 Tax=Paraclostridium ghonii TaxID=29358 RepID=A0ABU0N3G2_9FIRM|nr:hypothetical protein [Paeniclostridium ghonii]MCM0166129.1 hypothetical protein [Paeniclostridium ghonii]MDQ0557692.1 hypothetical protein [Paeniclostridium ghonii]
MDLDLLFKLLVFIVVAGIVIKSVKLIGSIVFKIALIGVCLLILYRFIILI